MNAWLTATQAETLREWRYQVGFYPAYIHHVFGNRNNIDNARRRTCRRLVELGQLIESKRQAGVYYAVTGVGERRYEGECPHCHLEIAVDLSLNGKDVSSIGWECPICRVPILLRRAEGVTP